jgi:hypothetical protein
MEAVEFCETKSDCRCYEVGGPNICGVKVGDYVFSCNSDKCCPGGCEKAYGTGKLAPDNYSTQIRNANIALLTVVLMLLIATSLKM